MVKEFGNLLGGGMTGDEGVVAPVHEIELVTDIDVFEMAAVGTIITDRSGCLRRVNPAFARLLGRDREDLVNKSFSSLTSPDDVAMSLGVMQDLLSRTIDVAQFEKRYLRPDGSIVWAELHIRSITDADGAVLELLVQVIDITDRKLAERAAERLQWQLEEAQSIAGMGSFELNSDGEFRSSDELCRICGIPTLEDVPSLMGAVHPDDRDMVGASVRASLEERRPADLIHRMLRPDGDVRWVQVRADWVVNDDGHDTQVGTLLDITDRKLAEQAAERLHWQLEEAQSIAGMGSFEMNSDGAIRSSDELCRICGIPTLEDVPTLMGAVHPDDRDTVGASVRACLEERRPADLTHRMLRPDGDVRWVQVRADWVVNDDGQDTLVGTLLDITDRKLAEEALEYQAFHDTLTGLANRALFLDRVNYALQQRGAAPVAVVFLDLDDFKTVNDSLGHPAGDQLLISIAQRLASVARVGDTVARFGGDEFAFLLEFGIMPETAEEIARRIQDILRSPILLGDTEVVLSASIGVATGLPLQATATTLLRDADLAMYLAKRSGKGRFELFRQGMEDESLKRFAVTADLRHALDHGELEVFYQAIVDSHDGTPVGAEALVRWHHPRRGLVQPIDFIDVAESTGLVVPLGEWILNEACRQVRAWRHASVVDDGFYISVNLSARQLAEPSLAENVDQALRDSGLQPDALVLEITESSLMLDFDAGLAQLQALKALGLRIALDDYGTGYSSLNRLRELPVDIIKIDKSFIDRLGVDQQGAALVKSVIDVTRALGIHSIAEGVELQSQRVILDEMKCDHIQGYLFAEPTPPADTVQTLRRLGVHRSDRVQRRHRQKGTGRSSIRGPVPT